MRWDAWRRRARAATRAEGGAASFASTLVVDWDELFPVSAAAARKREEVVVVGTDEAGAAQDAPERKPPKAAEQGAAAHASEA